MSSLGRTDEPFIFVAVGTDHHPFHRLMEWAGNWASRSPSPRLFVQSGNTPAPDNLDAREYLGYEEVQEAMQRSLGVVCHGGPATIIEVRRCGRIPIVVPRRASLGEHVDDHQWLFSQRLAADGQIRLCETADEWSSAMEQLVNEPDTYRIEQADDNHIAEAVETFSLLVDPLIERSLARAQRRRR